MKDTRGLLTAALLLSLTATLFIACAKHPASAIAAAEQALLDARKVNAQKCASEKYEAAEQLLQQAREQERHRLYEEASATAKAAVKMADLALAAAVKHCPDQEDASLTARRRNAVDEEAQQALGGMADETISVQTDNRNRLPGGETLRRIHFAFDSFSLTAAAQKILKENAAIMGKYPAVMITVEGHCDSRGSTEYNLALGERRGQRVLAYLVDLGVAAKQLQTVSMGEESPLDTAETEHAWAQNRRAEFIVAAAR